MKRQIAVIGWVWALGTFAACASSESSGAGAGTSGAGGGGFDSGMHSSETVSVIGAGADADSPTKFAGYDDPNAKPTIVYPANDVVLPPNLRSLEIHFVPGAGQSLFELSFESPAIALIYYIGCEPLGDGCVFQTDAAFWDQFVQKNRGIQPIRYRIRGVDGNAPSGVGTSVTGQMAFAWDNIVGGIYYWNSAGVIHRYEFGAPGNSPELFMTAQMAGASACVGCHGLSRDGKKMVIGQDMAAPAAYKIYDVGTRAPITKDGQPIGGTSNFFSFSPDGAKLLFSDGIQIGVQDANTGAIENPSIASGTMPDWSPSGERVVYAKPETTPTETGDPSVESASLELLKYDGKTFSPERTLVSFAGKNNFYPAFSPAKDWVVFNRSPGNMDSYSSKPPYGDGELWAVNAVSGAPLRLETANAGGGSSWPKWVPDASKYHAGEIMWVTVSSARAYGLRSGKGERVQLWMFGFDPGRGTAGKDPSLPAFWFPYQDTAGSNHIAQWVTHVDRTPCSSHSECQVGEECQAGWCYSVVK